MIVPMSAHLAEADPTSRLTKPLSSTMPASVTPSGIAISRSALAPLMAISAPRFDWPKAKMNWAQKNAITM